MFWKNDKRLKRLEIIFQELGFYPASDSPSPGLHKQNRVRESQKRARHDTSAPPPRQLRRDTAAGD
jgi:hypothetical protein